MKRRNFLKNTALASTAAMVPSFLQAYSPKRIFRSRSEKILVVVQLSGGNDGLNTIVPYRNDLYYQQRPTLAIPEAEVIKVSDELGFHPAMAGLRAIYEKGLLSVVNSVGYPNPDRSHFRSMDIWHTASASDTYLSTGWLGRYLDHQCTGCDRPYTALELDDTLSLALKGAETNGFAMSSPEQLKKMTSNRYFKVLAQHAHDDEENVAYLYKTLIDTQASADYLATQARIYTSRVTYPATDFGRDLKQIAELITADTDTHIYYVSLTGFDTHAGQQNTQQRLLEQYSAGMQAFVEDLSQNKLLDDTLIMTFSEFGRRVQQNASGGTDHGTANNLFLIGGQLSHPGFFNAAPDLSDLDEGDLRYQIDFREVYATVLGKWLNADVRQIMERNFTGLPLL
ncbi:MAG: DUF1501 domain-containing protein [Saprospiraceae bacterium]|nr:DUF1501 domain-containing protein [Lewinella sp.]